MTRLSGLLLGLGVLIVLAQGVSPAYSGDDDDDDDYKYRNRYPRRVVVYPPVLLPTLPPAAYGNPSGYELPQGGPILAPSPDEPPIYGIPSDLDQRPNPILVPQPQYQPQYQPQPLAVPHEAPGQFVNGLVPLYPAVRIKDRDEAPRFGLHRVIAMRDPNPCAVPQCVYVQICVPPCACQKVKVEDRGAKIELDYGDYEIKIESERGVVTVEYDD